MKLEADSFRIKVTLDQKPTLRLIQPDESLGVTPIAEVPIEVEARDDFGVASLESATRLETGQGKPDALEFQGSARHGREPGHICIWKSTGSTSRMGSATTRLSWTIILESRTEWYPIYDYRHAAL